MQMDTNTVANRIREVMQSQGLTITEMANRMGKAKQTVSTILSGGNPTISTLEEMANAIGVPVAELLPGTSSEELTALVYHKGAHYRATTLEELRGIVEELERATAEATSAETSGRSDGR